MITDYDYYYRGGGGPGVKIKKPADISPNDVPDPGVGWKTGQKPSGVNFTPSGAGNKFGPPTGGNKFGPPPPQPGGNKLGPGGNKFGASGATEGDQTATLLKQYKDAWDNANASSDKSQKTDKNKKGGYGIPKLFNQNPGAFGNTGSIFGDTGFDLSQIDPNLPFLAGTGLGGALQNQDWGVASAKIIQNLIEPAQRGEQWAINRLKLMGIPWSGGKFK